jgi:formyltetrahydrofolate synthetase
MMQTDIEIAQLAKMRKISDVARNRLGIPEDNL